MAAPLPLGCATRGKCTIKKLIFAKNVYFCRMLQATVGVQPFLLWGSCRPTVGVQPVLPWGPRDPTVEVDVNGLWGLAQVAIEVDAGNRRVAMQVLGDENLLLYYFTFLLFGRYNLLSMEFIIYIIYIYNKNWIPPT